MRWVLSEEKPKSKGAYWCILNDGLRSKNGAWFDGEKWETYKDKFILEWLEETESKPGGGEKLVQDEDLKDWYPGECSVCGYRASSCEWSSHAIADTGDHSDPTCPICGNIGLEEIENVQPKQDQRPYEYIKKLEKDNSYLHDKIIDLKYESPSPDSKEAGVNL